MGIKSISIPLKRISKFLLIGIFNMILMSTVLYAQQRSVTGTVTSSSDGLPLTGVNIIVLGTPTGTISDNEGNYSLDVPEGRVTLQFSSIGFAIQLIQVDTSVLIDVSLVPKILALDEVVVTSLGITREKKQITYSAQNVETENISQARELNVANFMAGKVAGMDLIKTSSGLGSATRIVLRGMRSITGNNQPLYIVDGVPISNISWSEGMGNSSQVKSMFGGLQGGDGISNINPDDVLSITVLKGPNAVALYGSRAANGAVVLTTKKGTARKGIGVEFNTNSSIDKALILTKYQHEYGQGNGGVYIPNSGDSWGPEMDGQLVDHWSSDPDYAGVQYPYSPHHNVEEFFQTGYNFANTLTLTAGSDKVKSLFSYTNTIAQGIVETNKLRRHNFHMRIDGNLTPKLSFDTKLTYFNQAVDNRLATGYGDWSNPMRGLYSQPSNISLEEASHFEYFDDAGIRHSNDWVPNRGRRGNVYWMLNRSIRKEERNRILGMASLRYRFTDHLSFMLRTSFDQIFENRSYKYYGNGGWDYGNLYLDNMHSLEMNSDFLLKYNSEVGELFSVDVSLGGNMLYQKSEEQNMQTDRLIIPDLFVITNTNQIRADQDLSEKKIHSLYGIATIGIKEFLYLDITGRNDWSSTLPKENWSYFYPSVGLTWIITEMFSSVPSFLTFAKIRASYAEVGNDTDPYLINKTYGADGGGNLGYVWNHPFYPTKDLKPEESKSTELGFDIRLFRNRLGFDFTWYNSNTFNQLLPIQIPPSSGYLGFFINAGNIRNRGVEITLNASPLRTGNFSWEIMANFARNENLCIELTDELDEYITRGWSYLTIHKAVEGEPLDQIYIKGFVRNDEDRILINDQGLPISTTGKTVPGGNSNPDWTGGLTNSFNYKGFTMSVLIDVRMGGDIYSYTEVGLTYAGLSEATLEGREGFVVDGVMESDGSENTIVTTAEAYWKNVGAMNDAKGEPYRYDASYVRVREVLVGYEWSLNASVFQSIAISFYGRNLGFIYNASGIIDPGMSVGTGNAQGIESFAVPSSKSYGINARFKF